MNKIYKYGPLGFIPSPIMGEPKHVAIKDNGVYVWCVVNDQSTEKHIQLYPTGVEFNGEYVGSVIEGDEFVWHAVIVS